MSHPQAHAHKLVLETAISLAHELYNSLMFDDELFAIWKKQNPGASPKVLEAKFVRRHTEKCLPTARATLAAMLTGPLDEQLKNQIYEALCLDATLKKGRSTRPFLTH